ncbi:tonB-system energizer ExbB, partial [Pseudomonas mosselii]|nr:tonB-system energizer ExbB [Pseudomonas mosselii]
MKNSTHLSSSGPASMTRTQPSASPTPSRAWRAIAALMFSLVLAPAAMAEEP